MSTANYIKENNTPVESTANGTHISEAHFNIEIELNSLEELILNSTNIPLTELAVIDRDLILHQLNIIKENLPADLATAIEIANHQQKIIEEAKGYACLIVKSAKEQVSKILQESSILRQAELDGAKIRLQTERECEQLKQTTWAEIERLRQDALSESVSIQKGADSYADNVLGDLEQRLQQMLEVIQNGRQQLDRE